MSQPTPSPLSTPLPWDLVSEGYEAEIVPTFERYARDALDLAPPRPTDAVLDVAAGPGTLSLLAATLSASVTAVDFSVAMVERLEGRARARGMTNVTARVADGQALPFDDASFDVAFSMFGLMFFADRHRGLSELRRVLRPGGTVLVSSWHPADEVPVMRVVFGTLRTLLPGPVGPVVAPLSSEASIVAELTSAGFVDVVVHTRTHAIDFADTDALFASFERSNAPLVLLRSRLDAATWSSLSAAIRTALRAEFGAGSVMMEMPAYLGVGRVPS